MGKDRNAKVRKGKEVVNQGADQFSALVQDGEQAGRASKKEDRPSASPALLPKQPVPPLPSSKAPSSKDFSLAILQRSPPRNKRDPLRNKDEVSSQSSEEAVLELDPPRDKVVTLAGTAQYQRVLRQSRYCGYCRWVLQGTGCGYCGYCTG